MTKATSTGQTKRRPQLKVASIHYTDFSEVGGVETVMMAHDNLFAEHLTGGRDPLVIARSGTTGHILRQRNPLAELRGLLRDYDVVVVHNVLTMPFDLPLTEALWKLAEEMPRKRWFAWVHDLAACNPDYDHPWHQAPWQRLTQASPHFTYVAVSEHRARQFEALTGVKARVIPNGIDPAVVLEVDESMGDFIDEHALLEREIVLIQPARLVRRKKIELGLEVVAELRRRGRDAVTLITAADDPHNAAGKIYAKELRARREELGLKEVAIFAGGREPLGMDEVSALYRLSDAVFVPSRDEGFGLPVLEAAVHRLPVFCTDIEPLNALLEHGVHVFAPDASPADVATLVERTLDRSPAHRARREVLRRYSWEAIWRDHLAPLLRG